MTRFLGAAAQLLLGLPQRLLLALVLGYRLFFKAWLGNACRFEPSCSQYALDALRRHGALAGSALTTARLLRCHPWCAGGTDPVPAQLRPHVTGLFTSLIERAPRAAATPKKHP